MSEHITGFQTEDGVKKYDYNALANRPTDATNTVISPNADYAEVGEWADGNSSNEDRIGYFVAVATVADNTIKIRKATAADDVRGVTVYNPAFSGNASADKYGAGGALQPQYNYVGIMGIVSIIDNGKCSVGGRCMPATDGTAIPSTNNMGYAVLERVDSTHVLIAVEPGADMVQRVKTDVDGLNDRLDNDFPEAINDALAQAKASGEFDGADGETPVKGTDYFTAADKAEMVNSVKESIEENGLTVGAEGDETTQIEQNYVAFTSTTGEGAYMTSEGDDTLTFYGTAGDLPVQLKNLKAPSDTKDAATKEYVDGKVGALSIPTKVSDLNNDSGYIIEDDVGNYILDSSEEWTFTLANGSTVTKRVVLG